MQSLQTNTFATNVFPDFAKDDITDKEYAVFRKLIFELAGIRLGPAKRTLVAGRLNKRLRYHGLSSFTEYLKLINDLNHPLEKQVMVDLLTTNETYFFREQKHFEYLESKILTQNRKSPIRIWSAASSSGEEAYSTAMVLAETHGTSGWEILGTDISENMLNKARDALYPLEAMSKIPEQYLFKYCLRGVRSQEGYMIIDRKLRERVTFKSMNLNGDWPDVGMFDVIYLRNVMIYFDATTKKILIHKILKKLRSGGYLFIGHSESINGITDCVRTMQPSVYRKL